MREDGLLMSADRFAARSEMKEIVGIAPLSMLAFLPN